MRRLLLCLFIASTELSTAVAAPGDWQQVCAEARTAEFPPQDLPSAEAALDGCVSVDLYFGIGRPANPALARQCAYLEMNQGDELLWGGSSVLMMVYANGRGAARNFNLAIRLACENDLAPGGGQDNRVIHLARLREEDWQGQDFSICDDTTSGYWQGGCAWLEERIATAKREAKLKRLTAAWSESDRRALAVLRTEFEHFLQARVEHEVDASGTARAMFAHQEQGVLRDGFLAMVGALERGKIARFGAAQFAHADHQLNLAYRKIQSDAEFSYGTVTREGIRETQRLWIRYRDALAAFGRQRYPHVSPETLKTWLTRERIRMLQDYLRF